MRRKQERERNKKKARAGLSLKEREKKRMRAARSGLHRIRAGVVFRVRARSILPKLIAEAKHDAALTTGEVVGFNTRGGLRC